MTDSDPHTALSARAATALRELCAVHARVVDAHQVAAVCELEVPDAQQVMEDLADAGYTSPLPQRTEHDAAADYELAPAPAASEPEPIAGQQQFQRRWIEYLLAAATHAEKQLTPSHRTMPRTPRYVSRAPSVEGLSDQDLLDWLERRSHDLEQALAGARAAGWTDLAVQLADAMWPLLLRRRDLDLWLRVIRDHGLPAARDEALRPDLDAAGQAAAREMVRRMLTTLAGGLRTADRTDKARPYLREALAAARDDRNLRDQAQALDGLGAIDRQAGRYDHAIPALEEALQLRKQIGYTRGAALTRIRLSEVATDQGRYDQAIEHLRHARSTLLAEPDPHDAARALALLGHVYLLADRPQDAETHLRQARQEFQATGSLPWAARTSEWLANAAQYSGDVNSARDHLNDARICYFQSHSVDDLARVTGDLRVLLRGGQEQDDSPRPHQADVPGESPDAAEGTA
nr:tetratricopeptide repeat protein [Streptomyces sp. NBC_00899]